VTVHPSAFQAALLTEPDLATTWDEGLALERRELLLESAARYESLATRLPDSAFLRWRIARNYWRFGERLPTHDKVSRMGYFELAEAWADESLRLQPECGECVLWKLAAKGRQATTGSRVKAAGLASEIGALIERGIALRPAHRDNESNATLANLYYAGAAFYRILPDWFWLKWMIGIRGDKRRSLAYIEKALEITGSRVDYQVELGAVLLCLGHSEKDSGRIEEGRGVLRHAMGVDHFQSTDAIDVEHAHILIEEPEKACGYSRDGWIDLKPEHARQFSTRVLD
jgi:tetratricopeptide (TPR) repeat protein